MTETQYKTGLKRAEYLMDLEEHGVKLIAKLKLELYELIESIEKYEKDMI